MASRDPTRKELLRILQECSRRAVSLDVPCCGATETAPPPPQQTTNSSTKSSTPHSISSGPNGPKHWPDEGSCRRCWPRFADRFEHRGHRLRPRRPLHRRQPRLHPPADIKERVLTTLHFILNQLPHEHGFFYHFVDINTGTRLVTAKSLRSIPQSCCAACSPHAPTSTTPNSRPRHHHLQPRRLAVDAQRRPDLLDGLDAGDRFLSTAGTTTAN